tara:strand:- start:396 stop:554 length:159 start_codon:yes stop_codon:yes gene_type:complete
MEDILSSPIFWAAFALVSELVGASKLRQNGVVAVIFDTIKKMKPKEGHSNVK